MSPPPPPSPEHEAIVEMVREQPSLAMVLLGLASVDVPQGLTAKELPSTLGTSLPDYHPDSLIALHDANGDLERVVVVEAQTSFDADKLFTWPLYQALARARHRAPCEVVVVTLDDVLAEWARRGVVTGAHSTFRPLVVGPIELRRALGSTSAELEFLAALANVRQEMSLASRLVAALGVLPDAKRELYCQVMIRVVGETSATAFVEAVMQKEPFLSDFSKRQIAEAFERGRNEGRMHAAEAVEALRKSVRTVLQKRGMAIAPADMPKVETCTDVTMLTRWLERALSAADAADVFR